MTRGSIIRRVGELRRYRARTFEGRDRAPAGLNAAIARMSAVAARDETRRRRRRKAARAARKRNR